MRQIIVPGLCVMAVAYFGYHAVQGDYGLLSWWRLSGQLEELKVESDATVAERERLQHRVNLMRPDALDPDMLDERARQTLGLIHPDEVILLDANPI